MQDNHFAKDEAVSNLIKSMRFGNFEVAGYWLVVLVENGTNEKYLAKRLAVFASEDCFEQIPNRFSESRSCNCEDEGAVRL